MRKIILFGLLLLASSVHAADWQQTTATVYQKLIRAIGNRQGGIPELRFSDEKRHVAYFSPNKVITFEKAAFEVCSGLGADSLNAVAYILSHELGHHYRGHHWIKEAGSAYASLEIGKSLRDSKSAFDAVREADADEFACFYSIVAGYDLKDPAPLLRAIYKAYELPEKMNNYPSLQDRVDIALKVRSEAAEMADVFRFANLALLTDKNELAIQMYGIIINNKLGGSEVFNNLGVAQAQMAVRYLSDTNLLKLAYPFEVSATSRLFAAQSRSGIFTDSVMAKRFLNDAILNFKTAAELDPDFAAPYRNLSIVYGFFRDTLERCYWLEKAIRVGAFKRDSAMHQYIKALHLYMDGNIKAGEKKLTEIRNSHSSFGFASQSYNKIKNLNINETSDFSCLPSAQALSTYEMDTLVVYESGSTGNKKKLLIFNRSLSDVDHTRIEYVTSGNERQKLTLMRFNVSNVGNCPINLADLQKLNPSGYAEIGDMTYLVWNSNKVMVSLANGKVVSWYRFVP
ncbi:MAG: hypothetical protein ACU4F9_04225 [Arcticibacter sp.]